jgi:hypothetical protein
MIAAWLAYMANYVLAPVSIVAVLVCLLVRDGSRGLAIVLGVIAASNLLVAGIILLFLPDGFADANLLAVGAQACVAAALLAGLLQPSSRSRIIGVARR